MKRIFILIMAIVPIGAFAAAPSTSCPTGYVAVVEFVYGNREQHVSQWIYIRRYGVQLSDFITGRFVYNVCTNRCNLYRRQRFI